MDCTTARELISARIDGETDLDEEQSLADHLATCPGCVGFEAATTTATRALRVRTAQPVPDQSAAILARVNVPSPGRHQWIRASLAWVGVLGIARALPDLLLGHDGGATTHVARHVGALTVALFVGFLYAAWRPHRAVGMLPIALALAVTMVVSAVVDVTGGAARAMSETAHLVDLAGVVLLWLLAGSPLPPWSERWLRRLPRGEGRVSRPRWTS